MILLPAVTTDNQSPGVRYSTRFNLSSSAIILSVTNGVPLIVVMMWLTKVPLKRVV